MTSDAPDQAPPRLKGLIDALSGHPWRALAALLAVTAAAGAWGSGIPIKGDMEALFPEDTPTIQRAREARALVGSPHELQVLIGSPDVELNRRVGRAIADGLAKHTELIERVDFERDISFFETNALLYLPLKEVEALEEQVAEVIREAVRKDMALDDFEDDEDSGDSAKRPTLPSDEELKARYGGRQLSRFNDTPDGQAIAVKAYPSFKPQDLTKTRALMTEVEAVIAEATRDQPVETTIVGDYSGVSQSVDQITEALGRSTTVALALIIVLLALYFRRLRAVALVLVPLIIGVLWTVCFARLAIGQLNLISAFIFAILLGLGIDFAVHAMGRVDEATRRGMPLREALAYALPRLGRAMGVAAVTTIATFLSLTLFDFRGFSQFGWIAAGGVALSLAAVYLTLPALSVAMHRLHPRPVRPPPPPPAPRSPAASRRLALATVLTVLAATTVAALGLGELRFDGDMRKMQMAKPPETNALRIKYFGETRGSPSPALVITESLEASRAVHRHVETLVRQSEHVGNVASIYSFVPEQQKEKLALVAEMKRRIDQKYGLLEGQDKADADRLRAHLSPSGFGPNDLPQWLKDRFTDTSGAFGRYVLIYPMGIKSKAEVVIAINEVIGTLEVDGTTYHPTASWMFTGEAYLTVRREGPLAVGLAALVVFMLLLIDLRRFGRAVLTFAPLGLGFVSFLGVMGWAGIPLNLFNVVVLPTIFGIGVDTAIHLDHRLRGDEAVSTVLRTTGAAAAVSAITTAIGFASLLVVDNEGLRSIGWIAVIGIGCTTLCTTALIAAFETLRRGDGATSAG